MILFLSLFTACEKDVHDHHHHHDHEMMTTVVLAFTDEAGQESSFRWSDMGGTEDVEIDDIVLSANTVYQLDLSFLNELEEEPEDVTPEINQELDKVDEVSKRASKEYTRKRRPSFNFQEMGIEVGDILYSVDGQHSCKVLDEKKDEEGFAGQATSYKGVVIKRTEIVIVKILFMFIIFVPRKSFPQSFVISSKFSNFSQFF